MRLSAVAESVTKFARLTGVLGLGSLVKKAAGRLLWIVQAYV